MDEEAELQVVGEPQGDNEALSRSLAVKGRKEKRGAWKKSL